MNKTEQKYTLLAQEFVKATRARSFTQLSGFLYMISYPFKQPELYHRDELEEALISFKSDQKNGGAKGYI